MTVQILGIAGSLRTGSYNRKLLDQAGLLLPEGSELTLWNGLAAVPPFSEDEEGRPGKAVVALRAAIATADGVLIATPEYNGSIPGQLKNALDWASRPFPDSALSGKPVAVIGASPSSGGAGQAQAEARIVLARIGARVLDGELRVPEAQRQFDSAGALVNADLRHRLARLLAALARSAAHRGSAA